MLKLWVTPKLTTSWYIFKSFIQKLNVFKVYYKNTRTTPTGYILVFLVLTIPCHWDFSMPPENIRKPELSWYFQGVLKETKRKRWANKQCFHGWFSAFDYLFVGYHTPYRSCHRRCSIKKVFLKISQNSQENTGVRPATLLKRRL